MTELEELRREVRQLRDRQAIQDLMVRYTHALDRHDWDTLLGAVFHPDAVCDYGVVVGSPAQLVEFLDPYYEREYRLHYHMIGNHAAEIEGDTAHAQTYCVMLAVQKDNCTLRTLYLRYVDRLERRHGHWRIALRRMMLDARSVMPVALDAESENRWDRSDAAYQRPLGLPSHRQARMGR